MATIGYFEGTDSKLLTKLTIKGHETLPLSNGVDNYGKYIAHVTPKDNIALVIGYLHKVLPVSGLNLKVTDILSSCYTHGIPVVLIVSQEDHPKAKELLADFRGEVTVISPERLEEQVFNMLK